ncbi:MAG: hypothetical protein WEA11_00260 [Acidimicrobiales bacterium]
MANLDEVGEHDNWRCWLCDQPVDPEKSVNDSRGPSIDSMTTKSKTKGKGATDVFGAERLAHRDCNTKKGAIAPVVAWPDHLFVVDPAPIFGSVERLARKGGREVVARCPSEQDATEASTWLLDRLSRLAPDLAFSTQIDSGGGQYLLILRS